MPDLPLAVLQNEVHGIALVHKLDGSVSASGLTGGDPHALGSLAVLGELYQACGQGVHKQDAGLRFVALCLIADVAVVEGLAAIVEPAGVAPGDVVPLGPDGFVLLGMLTPAVEPGVTAHHVFDPVDLIGPLDLLFRGVFCFAHFTHLLNS